MIYKEFEIRPANNSDVPDIKNVVYGVLQEYNLLPSDTGKDNDLSDIEQNFFNKGGYFGVVVAINSNEIVGTFGLYNISNTVCELRKMYLLKKVRGMGLGKFLLAHAIQVAIEKYYKKMILETITPLKEAISLYKQKGFIEITPSEINERVDQAFELILH